MGVCQCKEKEEEKMVEILPGTDEEAPMVQAKSGAVTHAQATSSGITVAIVGAWGLRDSDWLPFTGKSDCYCTVRVKGKDQDAFKTQVIKDSLTPVWKEECEIADYGEALEFKVCDDSGAILGKVQLQSSKFKQEGFNDWMKLEEAGKDSAFLRVKVKLPGKDYPQAAQSEVTVTVTRESGKPWGLDLDTQDLQTLYVTTEATQGAVREYNSRAEPAQQIQQGDFIVKVNSAEMHAARMLNEMKNQDELQITLRRPEEFLVAINRSSPTQSLGAEFPSKLVGNVLVITKEISDGTFLEWNNANPDSVVTKGDRIIAVGNKRGTAMELLTTLSQANRCHVTIVRPSTPEGLAHW
mmetsp:Transcript_135766/g.378324  ORF Transcript_135766/g.378324 Transcript_135766/m.378324 type:complete len:353 (-) Transcript_135766:142-1200(-)|eukprot:CAMPEP_0179090756 /NCGR_PEP_ID=MMETSP0796-20121207/41421_1 /TAXON_ID=73915 /ORGANISM="Pyrodinium bahamense, Strain pbaha01" /LENGTH=352 /DNA_ID=CAMNT_0020788331 /DNA_START=105 /DNA_END=1163 /DNA_ORIENTATION=-